MAELDEATIVTNRSLLPLGSRLAQFYRDREYFSRLFKIALPIALQNFVTSSLNMVGVVMIGQLGEASVAAVGLANQVFFLLNLLLFGITSGSAMFTAQLWGKRDLPNVRRVLGLSLKLSLLAGVVFLALAEFVPAKILGIYSRDPQVVSLGSQYLQIFGWSFFFAAITFSFAAVLRSVGEVKLPLVVSMAALSLNTLLSYVLIFGHLGLPAMGTRGAAVSILVARVVECAGLLYLTYRRRTPAAISLGEVFQFDADFARRVLKPVLPVAANEMLWSLGITAYNVVYARIGTESIAAMNIAATIDNLAIVIFIGIANATAILVGNWIGAQEEGQAWRYAGRSLGLGMAGGVLMGGLIIASTPLVVSLYQVGPQVIEYLQRVLVVMGCLLWLRMANLMLFVGILRSGGDTRFAFVLDAGIIWSVGVPLAFIGAFVFHLPVYIVYLLVMSEEITKWVLAMRRFFSRKWIHNLAETV